MGRPRWTSAPAVSPFLCGLHCLFLLLSYPHSSCKHPGSQMLWPVGDAGRTQKAGRRVGSQCFLQGLGHPQLARESPPRTLRGVGGAGVQTITGGLAEDPLCLSGSQAWPGCSTQENAVSYHLPNMCALNRSPETRLLEQLPLTCHLSRLENSPFLLHKERFLRLPAGPGANLPA